MCWNPVSKPELQVEEPGFTYVDTHFQEQVKNLEAMLNQSLN